MALPASPNAISLDAIRTEWGKAQSNVALGDYYKYPGGSIVLAGDTAPNVPTVPGNAISFGNFHSAAYVPPTTVTLYPTSNTNTDSWTSPTNGYAVDGSLMSKVLPTDGLDYVCLLDGVAWSANIPSGATVNQVVLHCKMRVSGTGALVGCKLFDGTATWAQVSTSTTTLTEFTAAYAGITRAELLNCYFYVYASASSARTAYVDCAWAEVTYQ